MKKANIILVLVLTVVGALAQANPDCPLKNLKKHQLRGDTSTAYFPNRDGKANTNGVTSSGSGVSRTN